ncbi:hypothetical protein GCM10009682_45560 [Luedemannella flava]|uniref:Uncharacterized protein n=1 Tax=Luedemannella flava TaxID=349316 RepID=A0ABN2MC53_9ACTN
MRSRLTWIAVISSIAAAALSGCSMFKATEDPGTPEPTSVAQLTAVAVPPGLIETAAPVALPPIAVVGGPAIELAVHMSPGKCAVTGHDRDGKAKLTTVTADAPAEGAAGADASKLPPKAAAALGAANTAELKIKGIGTLTVFCTTKGLAITAPKEAQQLSVVGAGSAKMLDDRSLLVVIAPPATVTAALAS